LEVQVLDFQRLLWLSWVYLLSGFVKWSRDLWVWCRN